MYERSGITSYFLFQILNDCIDAYTALDPRGKQAMVELRSPVYPKVPNKERLTCQPRPLLPAANG